jgi:FtsP/CotA-like multicopper oxidase with cupredoxin domain
VLLKCVIPTAPELDGNRNPYPEVMCFDVQKACAKANSYDFDDLAKRMASLASYNEEKPHISEVVKMRTIAVVEKETSHGAVLVLWELMLASKIQGTNPILTTNRSVVIDGEIFFAVAERFHDPVSIIIPEGSTERWRFINLTADTHPMHMHLVQYSAISRRKILSINDTLVNHPDDPRFFDCTPDEDAEKSVGDTILDETAYRICRHEPIELTIEDMDDSTDLFMGLQDNEIECLKDTIRMNPGEMVEIIARFEEHCGRYVYHCHLLEHEDHDMMRQFIVTRNDLMPSMDMGDQSSENEHCNNPMEEINMYPISVGVDRNIDVNDDDCCEQLKN